MIGQANGMVKIYLNVNTDADPSFDGGTFLQVGAPSSKTDIYVGDRAAPAVVDWNGDGKKDLVVGSLDGMIHIFLNEGTDTAPDFVSETLAQDSGSDLVVPSARSSPCVIDLDGDDKKDLLSGNTSGELLLYSNTGTDNAPDFSGYTQVESEGVPILLPGSPRSRPFVCDWTGDGNWDILVGAGDGKVHLYQLSEPVIFVTKEGNHVKIEWLASGVNLYDVLYATYKDQDPFDPLSLDTIPPAYHTDVLTDGMDYCYQVYLSE